MTYLIKLDPQKPPDTVECLTTFGGWADSGHLRFLLGDEFVIMPTIVQDVVMLVKRGSRAKENLVATDIARPPKGRTVRGVAYMAVGNTHGSIRGMDFNRASHWCCALTGW